MWPGRLADVARTAGGGGLGGPWARRYTVARTLMAISVPPSPRADADAALRLDFRSDTITHPTAAMRDPTRFAALATIIDGG